MTVDGADLDGVPQATYGDQYNAHVLEQYKLYVAMADKISERRQSVNTFFLTLNTAVVTAISALASHRPPWVPPAVDAVICGTGALLCFTWHRMIGSYRDLNGGKFKVVHEMEKRLPLRPYDAEWTLLGRGKIPELYHPFTHIETRIPWAFAFLYLAMLFIVLCFRS